MLKCTLVEAHQQLKIDANQSQKIEYRYKINFLFCYIDIFFNWLME